MHSVVGLVRPEVGVVRARPFRAPHHSVSTAGLVGGGELPRPGEVSLAHHGVLFLDELAEFRRASLEALRQPLEDGGVCIARARMTAWYPARPLVVAAMNPCPCGYTGHPMRVCRCSGHQLKAYRARVSGPLLDRLDIHVALQPVAVTALTRPGLGESSAVVRERVKAARELQARRSKRGLSRAPINAHLPASDPCLRLQKGARRLLSSAVTQLGLSARGFTKVLRVARTLADLSQASELTEAHLAEAIQYRLLGDDGA